MTTNGQPELNIMPKELTVNGNELAATIARLEHQGASVYSIAQVPRHKAQWRLKIRWPRKSKGYV